MFHPLFFIFSVSFLYQCSCSKLSPEKQLVRDEILEMVTEIIDENFERGYNVYQKYSTVINDLKLKTTQLIKENRKHRLEKYEEIEEMLDQNREECVEDYQLEDFDMDDLEEECGEEIGEEFLENLQEKVADALILVTEFQSLEDEEKQEDLMSFLGKNQGDNLFLDSFSKVFKKVDTSPVPQDNHHLLVEVMLLVFEAYVKDFSKNHGLCDGIIEELDRRDEEVVRLFERCARGPTRVEL